MGMGGWKTEAEAEKSDWDSGGAHSISEHKATTMKYMSIK